jgi:lysophospholipase L1-like esterase
MKFVFGAVALALAWYAVYEYVRISGLLRESGNLVRSAVPYARADGARTMLVLGDSTAVGVGGAPEESVPARVSRLIDASVENYAESGAKTSELAEQRARAKRERYDLILIQAGANDVIGVARLDDAAADMKTHVRAARSMSDRVILLTSGKVGDAPLFPAIARSFFTRRAAELREAFTTLARREGAEYVDLFSATDVFKTDYARFYAPDRFHPSGEGYRVWFEEVRKTIQYAWPELIHG